MFKCISFADKTKINYIICSISKIILLQLCVSLDEFSCKKGSLINVECYFSPFLRNNIRLFTAKGWLFLFL